MPEQFRIAATLGRSPRAASPRAASPTATVAAAPAPPAAAAPASTVAGHQLAGGAAGREPLPEINFGDADPYPDDYEADPRAAGRAPLLGPGGGLHRGAYGSEASAAGYPPSARAAELAADPRGPQLGLLRSALAPPYQRPASARPPAASFHGSAGAPQLPPLASGLGSPGSRPISAKSFRPLSPAGSVGPDGSWCWANEAAPRARSHSVGPPRRPPSPRSLALGGHGAYTPPRRPPSAAPRFVGGRVISPSH